jgi:hypothetical protein
VPLLAAKRNVIINERVRNFAGPTSKRTQVVKAAQARIPYRFTTDDFRRAWKKLDVRPPSKSPYRERTDERYGTYDNGMATPATSRRTSKLVR